MLIRFEVENFRSIREPVELSMVAIDERVGNLNLEGIGVSLTPVAGIFGPNAAGKSNLLLALDWLRHALSQSLRTWDERIPVTPFAWGEAATQDSSFTLELALGGVRFEYLLDLNSSRVSYEALYHYPAGRRRKVFERDGNMLSLQRGLGVLSGARALLTDRSLALTIMRRFDEPLTRSFFDFVTSTKFMMRAHRRSVRDMSLSLDLFDEASPHLDSPLRAESGPAHTRQQALALLQLADLGIEDVEVDTEPIEHSNSHIKVTQRSARLVHRTDNETFTLAFELESQGTRAWFESIGSVMQSLQHGSLLVIDELDASLHPLLSAQLIELYAQQSSNPHGAQLIFSSHDASLLEHLKRDEVWFAEKLSTGATRFGALSEFADGQVRKSTNLGTSYLRGRFGALPNLDSPSLRRLVGLPG